MNEPEGFGLPEGLEEQLKGMLKKHEMSQKQVESTISDLEKEILMPVFARAVNGDLSYTGAMNIMHAYCAVLDCLREQMEYLPNEEILILQDMIKTYVEISKRGFNSLKEKLDLPEEEE